MSPASLNCGISIDPLSSLNGTIIVQTLWITMQLLIMLTSSPRVWYHMFEVANHVNRSQSNRTLVVRVKKCVYAWSLLPCNLMLLWLRNGMSYQKQYPATSEKNEAKFSDNVECQWGKHPFLIWLV